MLVSILCFKVLYWDGDTDDFLFAPSPMRSNHATQRGVHQVFSSTSPRASSLMFGTASARHGFGNCCHVISASLHGSQWPSRRVRRRLFARVPKHRIRPLIACLQ